MSPTLQALDRIVTREDDYATALQVIHVQKYTGSFIVHCRDGVPQLIEFPGVRVVLTRGGVDNAAKVADST